MPLDSTIIIGAGPAGLAAAFELARHGKVCTVLEASDSLGGLSRTVERNGYRIDVGGHRFYTRAAEIQRLWEQALGDDLVTVPRLSRIYYRQRFFDYPLSLWNTLANLGPTESLLIVLSYLRARLHPRGQEESFEQWVSNRFGSRLYRAFFRTYTEKVWGIPCREIMADWASQRIQDLTLSRVVLEAIRGTGNAKTLIRAFNYPRLGPGMLWQRLRDAIVALGSEVHTSSRVRGIHHRDQHITGLLVDRTSGAMMLPASQVISSMSLRDLVLQLEPAAPDSVREAAAGLRYRALVLVALIVDRASLFPDNWVYVHEPQVRVGRIQNAGNWSKDLVPDQATSSLGMEYFCDEGDELWTTSDEDLIALATRELGSLGLARGATVVDAHVVRQPKAYPVYDRAYRERLGIIREYLTAFDNLQTIGRNGMHRYNNMDHSMLTGMAAARRVLGEAVDLWTVNADPGYGEAAPPGGPGA